MKKLSCHCGGVEVEVKLPTDFGDFKLKAFKQITNNQLHLAIYKGLFMIKL